MILLSSPFNNDPLETMVSILFFLEIEIVTKQNSQFKKFENICCQLLSMMKVLNEHRPSWSFKKGKLNQAITITLRLTEHANIFLNTYPVEVFSHLSLQPLLLCTRSQQCSPTATVRSFGHFEHLELPLSSIVTWHLLDANSKLVKILNQAASTRCSGDNKEKLSTNIHSEYMRVISAMTGNPSLVGFCLCPWLELVGRWGPRVLGVPVCICGGEVLVLVYLCGLVGTGAF